MKHTRNFEHNFLMITETHTVSWSGGPGRPAARRAPAALAQAPGGGWRAGPATWPATIVTAN